MREKRLIIHLTNDLNVKAGEIIEVRYDDGKKNMPLRKVILGKVTYICESNMKGTINNRYKQMLNREIDAYGIEVIK